MSSEQKGPEEIPAVVNVEPPLKKRAVTLYVIIVFKIIKGLLCIGLALVIWHEARHDLSKDWQNLLHSPLIATVFGNLKIHPESRFWVNLAITIGNLTEDNMHKAAWGAVILSLFPLVEGIGLMFRVPWAGWLAIGESAFFIPIELYEMVKPHDPPHHFSWSILGVTIFNIIIVWYLYQYREVLFRHHHRHHHHPPAAT